MAFKDLTESEIIVKIKELSKKDSLYNDVLKQYYQELYQRYFYQCYNISRYYGLSKQDAEDAVQESFIKLLRSIRTFDENRPFKPWFFKVVLNSVKDKYKELKKHRYTDLEKITEVAGHEQEKFMDEFQMRDLLHSIIIRLPEKLKTAVVMRNYTDMSLEAISNFLGITVRQLHNRLAKAYESISSKLEENR